jgi:hypothetical protein
MMTFAEAAGSGLVTRFPVGTVRSQALLAGVAATFVAAAAFHPELLLPTAVCLAFLLGVAHPARAAAIQSVAGETMRARAASMANACDMACKMIALPLVGRWRRRA